MRPAPLELTIVVPAFNEAHRLADGMQRFESAVTKGAVDVDRTEVIVVDDGSTDDTAATAGKLLAGLPHHHVVRLPTNLGKGGAVRTGVGLARGRYTAYMDADMAIDPRAIPLLLDGLTDHDVAIGSRALPNSMVESTYLLRSVMGRLYNRLVTAGTGLDFQDTQCGFKAFRTPVARLLFHLVRIDRFAFDVEILARARRLGLTVTEVPVQWKHVPGSTVHPLHDSVTMLADIYRTRLGFRAAPPVPALTVRHSGGDAAGDASRIGAALSLLPVTPVPVVTGPGELLVLLPLVEPTEAAAALSALQKDCPDLNVSPKTMTLRTLGTLGPLAGRLLPPVR
jgi:glycosyltransferase involved in cell wall biosynthesis